MKKSIAFLSFLLSISGMAQITVDANISAESLVNDFLLGSGVLTSNVQYIGDDLQNGVFFNGDLVGMTSGLVLCTEAAASLEDLLNSQYINGVSGDPDLLTLANIVPELIGQNFSVSSINDVCSLEFDFIPYGDSLAFNYVFGSDEYLEWVNSTYNDVFGFFISGPGIAGPYSSPEAFPDGSVNIAFVPGSNPELPITVSSVNDVLNANYYVNNMPSYNIQLDGFTTVLTAYASNLQIGETYHIRMAIGDGSDTALKSAVLLESGSFSCFETVAVGSVGDFNNDGLLNLADLLVLLANFGCTGSCETDLNGDAVVNIVDILTFLSLFSE